MAMESSLKQAIALVDSEREEAEIIASGTEEIYIDSPESAEIATQTLAAIKERYKFIEGKRKAWVGPIKAVAADIDKTIRPVTKALLAGETRLKKALADYQRRQEEERDRLLKEAGGAESEAKRTDLISRATVADPEPQQGVTYKEKTVASVVDHAAAVKWCVDNGRLEWLLVDTKAIEAQAKALGSRFPEVAGVEVKKDYSVVVRSASVRK